MLDVDLDVDFRCRRRH